MGLGLGLVRERLERVEGEVVEDDEASARLRLRVSIQRGERQRPPWGGGGGGGGGVTRRWAAEEGASSGWAIEGDLNRWGFLDSRRTKAVGSE